MEVSLIYFLSFQETTDFYMFFCVLFPPNPLADHLNPAKGDPF